MDKAMGNKLCRVLVRIFSKDFPFGRGRITGMCYSSSADKKELLLNYMASKLRADCADEHAQMVFGEMLKAVHKRAMFDCEFSVRSTWRNGERRVIFTFE